MRFSKTAFSIATAAMIIAAPAFAQNRDTGNAGTAATGTSSSMSAMPPSQQTTTGRSDSVSKMGGTDAGAGSTKGTATGGPVGGNPTRN
jgi:hypothetical protein